MFKELITHQEDIEGEKAKEIHSTCKPWLEFCVHSD